MLSSLTFDLFQVGSFHSLFLTSFRSAQESWYSFLRSIGKETEAHAFEELIITEGKTEREREREIWDHASGVRELVGEGSGHL